MVVGNSKVAPKEKNIKSMKIVKTSSVTNTYSMEIKENTTEEEKSMNPRVDGALIGIKSRSQTLPFTLTFEIFNIDIPNCLVDSGASSNVIPSSVCKKINAQPKICKTKIIWLDRSHVKVMGELRM